MKRLLLSDSKTVFTYLFVIPLALAFGLDLMDIDNTFLGSILWNLLAILVGTLISLWYWLIGNTLNRILKPSKTEVWIYHSTWIFTLITIVIANLNSSILEINNRFVLTLGLIAAGLLLMNFYYLSKLILKSEDASQMNSADYLKLIFGLWFYPIGIWWIQPRIQRILALKL